MSNSLHARVVLVSGAGSGIGLGIARACAGCGATVVVADINEAARERTAEIDGDAHFLPVDVASQASVETLFAQVSDQFGGLHGLVNNAGITVEQDFLEVELDTLDRLWQVNQRSVFLMVQQGARLMQASGGGSIVNIASNHAQASVAGYEMYAATKAGIVAMSRAMAWSLGALGIRVNCISPGLTHTEAVAQVLVEKPELEDAFTRMHADGKYSTVEELGHLAAFLLSDQSRAMTGSNLVADHGLTASLCPPDLLK